MLKRLILLAGVGTVLAGLYVLVLAPTSMAPDWVKHHLIPLLYKW